jgi:uncharacterized protein
MRLPPAKNGKTVQSSLICYNGPVKRVDATEARRDFSRLYNEVAYGGERIIVENHGKGLVALVPARDLNTHQSWDEHVEAAGAPQREACLSVLRRERPFLEQAGVSHASIFGSVARGDADLASDVDIMLELKRNAPLDLFGLAAVRAHLIEALGRDVDLVTRGALHAKRDQHILLEAVRAF